MEKKCPFSEYLFDMKKTIRLTESDINRLVKKIIREELSQAALNSPKAQDTKKFQQVFNKLYNSKFNIDGNWDDKRYNETMARYIKDKGIPPYVCRKGDGYCHDDEDGKVTVKDDDVKKLYDALNADLNGGSKPKDVKLFQDWLDKYFPTWLKGGKLNKGKGYGTFGPNTKLAWTKYKSQYKEV